MENKMHEITEEEAKWMSEDGRIYFAGLETFWYIRNDWHRKKYYYLASSSGKDIEEVLDKMKFIDQIDKRVKFYLLGLKLEAQYHNSGGKVSESYSIPVILFNEIPINNKGGVK